MTHPNFNGLLMLFSAIAGSQLTCLLSEGKIFDPIFRGAFLKELRNCPLCLGFWMALTVSLAAGIYHPIGILAIAGIGHLITLVRERFLPCDKCKVPDPIPFKVVGNQ